MPHGDESEADDAGGEVKIRGMLPSPTLGNALSEHEEPDCDAINQDPQSNAQPA